MSRVQRDLLDLDSSCSVRDSLSHLDCCTVHRRELVLDHPAPSLEQVVDCRCVEGVRLSRGPGLAGCACGVVGARTSTRFDTDGLCFAELLILATKAPALVGEWEELARGAKGAAGAYSWVCAWPGPCWPQRRCGGWSGKTEGREP